MRLRAPLTASADPGRQCPAKIRTVALGGALLLAWLTGCSQDAPPRPRLVLLYAPCTVNRTYLEPYDHRVSYTPRLRSFGEEAVVFDNHYTESGQSGIAFAALFSGAQADHHGVYRHPQRLRDDVRLIFEAFAEAGWDTHYWNAHFAAHPKLNYAQGVSKDHQHLERLEADTPSFRAILERMRAEPTYRALVVANFSVTHAPYDLAAFPDFAAEHPELIPDVPDEKLSRWAALPHVVSRELSYDFENTLKSLGIAADEVPHFVETLQAVYAANVGRLDTLFGAVLDAIDTAGLREESLIAFTADHGEVLYRENATFQFAHSMQLEDDVLRVPLMLRGAGLAPGRYGGITQSIDVFPTLLGLATGSPAGEGVAGLDLTPALRGTRPSSEQTAYVHTTVLVRGVFEQMRTPRGARVFGRVPMLFPTEDVRFIWTGMRRGDLLFKSRRLDGHAWSMTAYEVGRGDETRNVFDPHNPGHAEAARDVATYRQRLIDGHDARREHLLPRRREQEGLRSLGYIE